MSAPQTIVPTLCTGGAATTVTAAPSLSVPAVLTAPHASPGAPVLCVCTAGGSIQRQGGGGHAVIHVQRDITVGGGCAVSVHAESSSAYSGSFSQASLGGGVTAAAPHALPKILADAPAFPAAFLGVIASRMAGKGIIYGVSQGFDLRGTQGLVVLNVQEYSQTNTHLHFILYRVNPNLLIIRHVIIYISKIDLK